MANEVHLAQLKQGQWAWKLWRAANHNVQPDLARADLREASLVGANLTRANLAGADLREASLTGASLTGAHLTRAHLTRAHLRRADLTHANLTGAHLTGANLRASLTHADLTHANLTGADLTHANLAGANLHGADLARACLSKTSIWQTIFADVDLSTARGLETIQHQGPSTIGIDTLYRSRGSIPEAFLRNAGVPDNMITYSKSLVGQPFQYYSCFISYSSHDEALAQRLHADLQDKGVRCWFAPEDLKIGDEFRSVIDASIQI